MSVWPAGTGSANRGPRVAFPSAARHLAARPTAFRRLRTKRRDGRGPLLMREMRAVCLTWARGTGLAPVGVPMAKASKVDHEFDPWKGRPDAVKRLLEAREAGKTLREAAAAAGVHIATVCRWAAASDMLDYRLRMAARIGNRRRYDAKPTSSGNLHFRFATRARPKVLHHPLCPICEAPVKVRGTAFVLKFWRCSRWPECPWASWRPRHPEDCPRCQGPQYWANSRMSFSCPRCNVRITTH